MSKMDNVMISWIIAFIIPLVLALLTYMGIGVNRVASAFFEIAKISREVAEATELTAMALDDEELSAEEIKVIIGEYRDVIDLVHPKINAMILILTKSKSLYAYRKFYNDHVGNN